MAKVLVDSGASIKDPEVIAFLYHHQHQDSKLSDSPKVAFFKAGATPIPSKQKIADDKYPAEDKAASSPPAPFAGREERGG